MSDEQHAAREREDLPRDGRDAGDPPVRDRPGDPGQEGGQVVGPGEIAPGPVDDPPDGDHVVEERRRHIADAHGGRGTPRGPDGDRS